MPYGDDMPELARAAVLARIRKDLSKRDYRRALHALAEAGHSQREISRWLGITQPSVASALKTAADSVRPLDGFSGATPYEIRERLRLRLHRDAARGHTRGQRHGLDTVRGPSTPPRIPSPAWISRSATGSPTG